MKERFSSTFGIVVTVLGMAVGTGNIWRFPRLVGQYGGGTFLIPWLLFLILWSLPIMIWEYHLGKTTQHAPPETFGKVLSPRYRCLGGFIGFCSLLIMAYYMVVTGWCLAYVWFSLTSQEKLLTQPTILWNHYIHSPWVVGTTFLSLLVVWLIVIQGIQKGVERFSCFFIPTLFILLIALAVRGLTLPDGWKALYFLGHVDLHGLTQPRIWMEALSQSAWSTGAGWGLILVYASYMDPREKVTLHAFTTGFGNNMASLLAAMAILPIVFSMLPADQQQGVLQEGNVGFTFLMLPRLFHGLPGGAYWAFLFFLALSFAALSSFIAMVELGTKMGMDWGWTRRKSVFMVGGMGFLFALPSSLSMGFFNNQDWVWGLGLVINGLLFIFLLYYQGFSTLQKHLERETPPLAFLGTIWRFILPFLAIGMLLWWMGQSLFTYGASGGWHPFRPYSVGTCLFQWTLLFLISWFFYRKR